MLVTNVGGAGSYCDELLRVADLNEQLWIALDELTFLLDLLSTGSGFPSVSNVSPGTSPQRSPWPAVTNASNTACSRADLPWSGFATLSGAASRVWQASRAAPSVRRGTPAYRP
jgi:hypothetical protein